MNLNRMIIASRPFSWVNTAFPFAITYILIANQTSWQLWLGILFFLFPYNLAMYGINDIYDYESDKKNPRKASIEGAQLKKGELNQLWWPILLWTIPPVTVLLVTGNAMSSIALLLSLFLVVSYSAPPFRFKEVPFLDSITSSGHFVTPAIFGAFYAGALPYTFIPALVSFTLWGVASHAFGAIQDINYDRGAGIGSIATIIGARATVLFSTICYIISTIIISVSYGTFGAIVSFALLLYALNCVRFIRINDENASITNQGWRMFLALNLGLGTLLTTGYIHINFNVWTNIWQLPIIISIAVYIISIAWLTRQRNTKE